ncbi:HupE/UreJ family protein [Mesorhizobium xinjiangense]|uniref:HupE/UreJ family protein n=1 Tax=Mesorhizobium xinjiangense TaxID=2678685 RepID=UPI0012EE3C2D|nr:HupE/UreJ family protein [Mesorhizobium xinjiangense]
MLRKAAIAAAMLAAGTMPAFAHLDPAEHGSFMAGFTHPLFGADHILAMVAVGLWAAMLGRRALWLVPGAFVGTMMIGFLAAAAGLALPFVEPMILASVVVIGLMVAMAFAVSAPAGMAVVGVFALFHGHAHGGEMGQAGLLGYALGFAAATAMLHLAGIGLGLAFGTFAGRWTTRAAGVVTALAGLWLAAGV